MFKIKNYLKDLNNYSSISFELNLNIIQKYGEFLINTILDKYLENYDIEES